jgi:hypothetical protein
MIIEDILSILKADIALKALLGATATDTKIYPYSTKKQANSIVYILSPVFDADAKRIDKLEIHIICTDLANAYAIDSRVRTILKTIGDTPNGSLLNVEVNGGGSLEDTVSSTYHIITYYYITTRS